MNKCKIVPFDPTGDKLAADWQAVPRVATDAMEQAAFEAAGSPSDWWGFADQWSAALAVAPSPWISVEERLPEPENGSQDSGLVLTYNTYGIIVGFYCHEEALWYYSDGEEIVLYDSEITHWVPLPEAPEVVE